MRVRIAALADYASISLGDKLNILGIFSNILGQAEPVVHPQMQMVVQMEFEPAEAGKKQLQVVLGDEDGGEVLSLSGEMAVPRGNGREPVVINQIFVFNNTSFPHFGGYEFQVLINGEIRAQVPVNILRAESRPAA